MKSKKARIMAIILVAVMVFSFISTALIRLL